MKKRVREQEQDPFAAFKILSETKMMLTVPLMLFAGLVTATKASICVKFWVSLINDSESLLDEYEDIEEDQKNALAIYTYTFFGIGTCTGAIVLGMVQDKFGHRASLSLLAVTIISTYTLFLVLNEKRRFDWTANLAMFIFGFVDNSLHTFLSAVLGFEFESKIVPFGARHFLWGLSVGSHLIFFSFVKIETQSHYRPFFGWSVIFGLFSTCLMFLIKYKKREL